jgi:threonylcarbamoyladenosine tRNA methylthiotransferase MtaB
VKVLIRTFGCRANQYDSEAVRALVQQGGHEIVESANDADVAVFNSCAVTSDAVADLRQAVRRANRERPELRSIVMGCASALPDATELKALPGVSDVLAGADFAGVASALGVAALPEIRTQLQSGARALLRIQDGCDEHCTFCATTLARGANRSRPIGELLREARVLAERHAEIVITGVHIGTYGRDLSSPRSSGQVVGTTLGTLMARLVSEVPDVRFRLTSIEVTEVDDVILDLMASQPRRLAPNIHAPLQSGSNAVLKRMGRHWYTAESYRAAAMKMAERLPAFGFGADIITGFPGEMDADHRATVDLVEALPFTYLHVFPYSPRPGTSAIRLPNAVAPSLARERAAELREVGVRKAEAYFASRLGQPADVVVIGRGRGLTGDYVEIAVPESLERGSRAGSPYVR